MRTVVPARRVLTAGIQAAVLGAVAASFYGVAIRAVGVPMRAGFLGTSTAQTLRIGSFAMGVVVCTVWATVLAGALGRRVVNPSRTFVRATVALAAASIIVPIGAAHTPGATKAALIGAHLLAAAIEIPVLNRPLRSRTVETSTAQVDGVGPA